MGTAISDGDGTDPLIKPAVGCYPPADMEDLCHEFPRKMIYIVCIRTYQMDPDGTSLIHNLHTAHLRIPKLWDAVGPLLALSRPRATTTGWSLRMG